MTGKPRADRAEGLGRRWVIIDQERRLKVHRWIARQQGEAFARPAYTINGALSRLLAEKIDELPD